MGLLKYFKIHSLPNLYTPLMWLTSLQGTVNSAAMLLCE